MDRADAQLGRLFPVIQLIREWYDLSSIDRFDLALGQLQNPEALT